MTTVIMVEYQHDPPADEHAQEALMARLKPCLLVREIELVQELVALDGSRALRVYRALDAASVRHAHRSAGVAFHAAWPAQMR
jgi:hypothetical protein